MPEALLSLVVPADIVQPVEDLLLEHPDLVAGFTTSAADGHGASVRLVEPRELVSGHAPRCLVQMVGEADKLQTLLALLRTEMPHVNLFYWLVPVLASGRLA